ncbi:MAG: divergent polysaccharide deacetylase family protein [Candidatus Cloacimonetes bacterium]|nr:divergent polysaccharide deacetylase family protein [Candidatus Cloacimonadota bacterium]
MPGKKKKKSGQQKQSRRFIYVFLFSIALLFLLYFLINNRIDSTVKSLLSGRQALQQIIEPQPSVPDALQHAANLLGVPSRYFRSKQEKDLVHYYIGINKEEIDLNFANSIITGHVELSGGEVVSGVETARGTSQIMEILDKIKSEKYKVTIYYQTYKTTTRSSAMLAIVVDDFGYYNNQLLQDFCDLDPNITFSILPGLPYSREVMQRAVASGHETMIHIPMEPIDYPRNNPGENAIYVHMSERDIRRKIQGYCAELTLCLGANNHMGSLATADKDIMKTVLAELKSRDLYFVDSRTSQSSVAYDVARELMVPSLENDLFLDTPDLSSSTLDKKINILQQLQQKKERILVITHCNSREQLEYLQKFLQRIKDMDIELVPVSRLFSSDLPEIL